MVIVKLISGLGNQLFQYAFGRKMALINNVPLKLDTSFYETQHLRGYVLDRFKIKAEVATKHDIEEVLKLNHLVSKLERYFTGTNKYYYKERKVWSYDASLLSLKKERIYLDGYWQNYKYYNDLDGSILSELTIADEAEPFNYSVYSTILQDEGSVSIHIRRGDYAIDEEANKMMGLLPLGYYDSAVAYINANVPNANFYIFSDDLNWAADNLKIDRPVTFVDVANGRKDYVELNMMSKCNHNIIANSTFSWWGAFINKNPGKIVIGPKNWVATPDVNAQIELLLPEWIKI
ncbi:alpha-1,2-fucosyltransferase [Mucilaginibacter calamicampi]|uniref:Alpha-1,2-fucosyltransferase n=1 Tax=Mucilaginibacter calamicampi TaxID=1302352 RepID=A0ABW2YYC4_9SPHI